jgi:HD-GYP domain-containing protein (c-di-GMP phosphodiesterase class II)
VSADPLRARTEPLRLVEILAPLSLVTDLGMGEPPEEAMRACLLATALARTMDLPEDQVADVYYTTLLRHIGCTATSHEETARFLPDETVVRPLIARTDFTRPKEVMAVLSGTARAAPVADRPRVIVRMMTSNRWGKETQRAVCEVADAMARRLEMGESVQRGVSDVFERWDGKGGPRRLRGEVIALSARFAQLASQAVMFDALEGPDAAIEVVRRRSGGWLDPSLADSFTQHGEKLLREVDQADVLPAVVRAEPEPVRRIPQSRINEVGRVFADMVDLKSPYLHGHSRGVAALAEEAGRRLGLAEDDVLILRRAALFHDLGRVGVGTGIWDKPGPLTESDRERVRLHPYHTERILARCGALAHLAQTAGMHHERQDGSGYHRQASAGAIPMTGRLLAAADAYHAMIEERPYRAALTAEATAEELTADAKAGRLDPEAVRAVLDAAGHQPARVPRAWPAGLTDREVDVLRLLAIGCSNREIGRRLFVSPRTAEHHVQSIYSKIGASTRAAAALFALEHDLLAR